MHVRPYRRIDCRSLLQNIVSFMGLFCKRDLQFYHVRGFVYSCAYTYGVATVSRIDKIVGLFCSIQSLLQGSFAEETYTYTHTHPHTHPRTHTHTHFCIYVSKYTLRQYIHIHVHTYTCPYVSQNILYTLSMYTYTPTHIYIHTHTYICPYVSQQLYTLSMYTYTPTHMFLYIVSTMGWLRLVGSLKLQVSFAEYSLFYRALLQKRPETSRSLLMKATPYILYIIFSGCICIHRVYSF